MKPVNLQNLHRTLCGLSAQPRAGPEPKPRRSALIYLVPGQVQLLQPPANIFRLIFFSQICSNWTLQSTKLSQDVWRQNVHCRSPGTGPADTGPTLDLQDPTIMTSAQSCS